MKPWELIRAEHEKWAKLSIQSQFEPAYATPDNLRSVMIGRLCQEIVEMREQIRQMNQKQQHGCADFTCPLCDREVTVS